MKRFFFAIALAVTCVEIAQAGLLGFGGFGLSGFGHHGFGGRYGGFVGFGTEQLQTRFETKIEDLMTDYDTGLAEIDDFFNSDEYSEIVTGVERLVDRYDLFLAGVERTAERFGDVLAIVNDDLTYYTDLITEYQARDDLSEERLDRILMRLTNIQDHLTTKIERLTDQQSTLSANLDSYNLFSTELSDYLAEIVAAGGGMTGSAETTTEIVTALAATAAMSEVVSLVDSASISAASLSALAATAVVEPTSGLLLAISATVLAVGRRPRARPGGYVLC